MAQKTGTVIIHDALNSRWIKLSNPIRVLESENKTDVIPLLKDVQTAIAKECWAAGFVSYEASPAFDSALAVKPGLGFPLAWFGLYERAEEILLPKGSAFSKGEFYPFEWLPSITRERYLDAIDRIRHYLHDGETYQVNFTMRLKSLFDNDAWRFFIRMITAQKCSYGAYIDTDKWSVCSASPEMFFEYKAGTLECRPMKGTVRRGVTHKDDIQKAAWLKASVKNRAENLMIVDMVRSDMGRIALTGTVNAASLFDIEKYPTLWQMTSTIKCRTDAGLTEIFAALFPGASITGAPKARTMQIISELEDSQRRLYTGAIGFITPEERMQFNVAIRTVIIDKASHTAEYGVGGGIVWDSESEAEYEECILKSKVLTHSLPEFMLLESLLWTPEEGYFLLDEHMNRIADSAEYFSIPFSMETAVSALKDHISPLPGEPLKVRLMMSQSGEISVTDEPVKPSGKIRAGLAKAPVDSQDIFLYHKTTNRAVYEKAKAEMSHMDDAILFNERGEITEGSSSNIVVEISGKMFTPPVSCGLLPGAFRGWLIKQGLVSERIIMTDDLRKASRIFFINSVRKWREACFTE